MVKYSFILPIYKVEKYLEKCVASILNQSFDDFEIILVDDGSPDRCPEICENLKKQDKRIKVVHKKNGGLCDARNAGLEVATGEYILFVDPDDYVSEDYLECINNNINDFDMLIFGHYNLFKNKVTEGFSIDEITNSEVTKRYLLQDNLICGYVWNKVFKSEIINKYNLKFDLSVTMSEDVLFCYQYLEKIENVKLINKKLIYYRQRKSSLISQKVKKIKASTLVKTYKYIIDNSSDYSVVLKSKSLYLKNYYKYKKYINNNDFDMELIESILKNDYINISKNDKKLILMYKYFPFFRTFIYFLKDFINIKFD